MTGHSYCTSWQLPSRSIDLSTGPCLMGIVNVTPDSFSDGGKYVSTKAAVEHALNLASDGAGVLDIGGESTRPYSHPVDEDDELRRVIPVIEALRQETSLPLSIDTSKPEVARKAIEAGAEIINDVTGLRDPDMISLAVESGAGVCAMHMQGTPQTMQDQPHYSNVVQDVYDYLRQRRDDLIDRGVKPSRICLDPGIGFGKTHGHNLELLREIDRFLSLDCPILVGHSRKGFIGKVTGDSSKEKSAGTLAVTLHLARHRVQVIRVHEVKAAREAIQMQSALNVLATNG